MNLILIINPRGSEQEYPNEWVGDCLSTFVTNKVIADKILQYKRQDSQQWFYFQLTGQSRQISYRCHLGLSMSRYEVFRIEVLDWLPYEATFEERSYGNAFVESQSISAVSR